MGKGLNKMSELGQSVYKALNFINEFNSDISSLIKSVEEKMLNTSMSALGDAATFWNHSRALYAPKQWIPWYTARIYVPKPQGKEKPDKKSHCFAFFNIYFSPKYFDEPIAIWGFGTQTEKKDVWRILDGFGFFGASTDSLEFLTELPNNEWKPFPLCQ